MKDRWSDPQKLASSGGLGFLVMMKLVWRIPSHTVLSTTIKLDETEDYLKILGTDCVTEQNAPLTQNVSQQSEEIQQHHSA